MRASECAARKGTARDAVMAGELEPLVRAAATRNAGRVRYLGQLMPSDVRCALRTADAYISAAHNET